MTVDDSKSNPIGLDIQPADVAAEAKSRTTFSRGPGKVAPVGKPRRARKTVPLIPDSLDKLVSEALDEEIRSGKSLFEM